MKNRQKKLICVCVCIVVMALSLLLLIFRGKGTELLDNSEIPVVDGEFVSTRDYIAPEVTLDGVLEEEQWKNASQVTYGKEETAETDVRVFYGESGIYIGAQVRDDELTAKNSRATYNSCFTVVLFASGTMTYAVDSQAVAINFDVDGNVLMKRGKSTGKWADSNLSDVVVYPGDDIPTYMEHGLSVEGTLNDNEADTGYCVEIFINYTMLELIDGSTDQDYGIYFETVYYAEAVKKLEQSSIYGLYHDTGRLEERRKINYAKYKIDGVDDDLIWKECTKYEFEGNSDYTVCNYIAEEGIYFFFNVKDDKVCADGLTVSQNDSLEIYLDIAGNGGKTPQTDDVQIRVDVAGHVQMMNGDGERWVNGPTINNILVACNIVNGRLNENADGYALEMFVPWSDLNVTKASSTVNVYFGARDWDGVVKEDGTRPRAWYGTGKDTSVPDEYLLMTKTAVNGRVSASQIVLDGVLTDLLWKDANVQLAFGGTVRILWIWTEQGCYFAMDVTDSNIVTENRRAAKNSSVEVYLDYEGNGKPLSDNNRAIIVDALGNRIVKTGANGKSYEDTGSVVKSGVIQTKTGYVAEIYVPWEEFGGSKPANMKIAFANRVFLPGETSSVWLNDGYCTDVNRPDMYAVFTDRQIAW